jgi:hypothetical protein
VSEAGADFDLLAASLRADAGDIEAFVEALATKLEASFPGHVQVDRKGGLLGGRKRVERMAVELESDVFELAREHAQVGCRRRTVVRGIALKSEELPLERWIDELSAALLRAAGESDRSRAALQRLLQG